MWDAVLAPTDAALPPASQRRACFYSVDGLLQAAAKGQLDFVNLLAGILREAGFAPILIDAANLNTPMGQPGELHFWMVERPIACPPRPGLFHVFPSYLKGFWYFDSLGIRNNASLRLMDFRPHKMAEDHARTVFDQLHATFVATGQTKFDQPPPGGVNLPDRFIFVPVQGFSPPLHYPEYVSWPDLLAATVAARGHRALVIKPHPLQGLRDRTALAALHDPARGIHVLPVNLHAALARADLVITRCSAVALEAMLHRKPAIVTAQVDFHHAVTTLHRANALDAAITQALATPVPYEKYLTWFFTQNLLQPAHRKGSRARILSLLARDGFPLLEAATAGFIPAP